MGYPCEGWTSLNCTETVRALPWVFDEGSQEELLRHCPVACKACDPDAAAKTSTTTTSTTTSTPEAAIPVDVRFSAPAGPPHLDEYVPEVGDAVVRGPGWVSGTADGGAGCVGTVVAVEPGPPARATVAWPDGTNATHSCGTELSKARASEPWSPACADNAPVGAKVRRGRGWASGDEDGGLAGTILDLDASGSALVEWPSGLVGTYNVSTCSEASELSVRAQRSGVHELLLSLWEEEMANALRLVQQEELIIAQAKLRAEAAETDEERADAETEIRRADKVLLEAEAMYDLAETHFAEALAALQDGPVGIVANDTAKAAMRACEGELQELQDLLRQLQSPDGTYVVVAVPRNESANPIHTPLNGLRPFGKAAATPAPTPAPPPWPATADLWNVHNRPGVVDGDQWRQQLHPFGSGQAEALLHRCAVVRPRQRTLVAALRIQIAV